MIARGMSVNMDVIDESIAKHKKLEKARWKILRKYTWSGFNPASSYDVRKLLFDVNKISIKKYTKTGLASVDAEVLDEYRGTHIVADTLLKWRNSSKTLAFFKNYKRLAVPDPLNPGGWCIHPGLNQVGPKTSRFSCKEPNLQNVPDDTGSKSIEPIQARTPFGPRPGYVWYCFDFSQVEVVIFAVVAQIQTMIDAVLGGRDMHSECANRAWGGEGNPNAVWAGRHALELDTGENPSTQEILSAIQNIDGYSRFSWKMIQGLSSVRKDELVHKWLKKYKFDIVEAEKSIHKKSI